jgi:hypothetical protein
MKRKKKKKKKKRILKKRENQQKLNQPEMQRLSLPLIATISHPSSSSLV